MNLLEQYPFLKKEYIDAIASAGAISNKGTIYSLVDGLSYDYEVPAKKLKNAKSSIGKYLSNDETLLLLFDDTLFGSATDGILFTDKKIHSKKLWEETVVIPYEIIDSISVSYANSQITLYTKEKSFVIGATGINYFLLYFNLAHLILGIACLIRTENAGIVLDPKEAQSLVEETAWYNTEYEGERSESKLDRFFDKHEDTILNIVEKLGIPDLIIKLEKDENWEIVIEKVYELLPSPVRLILSRDKVKSIILENKKKFYEKISYVPYN